MYYKTDRLLRSSNEEVLGEVSSSGILEGTAIAAERYPHELYVCENFVGESMNGFVMIKNGHTSIIGKSRSDMLDGPIFRNGNDGMITFTICDRDVVSGPEMLLQPNHFIIRFESGSRKIQLEYENNKLIYGVVGSNEILNYKTIIDNVDMNLNFNVNRFALSDYPFDLKYSSDSRNDYKSCKQTLTTSNPYGYGFVKWEAGEMCISQFYFEDRHGLGCYRWPNGQEYIGQFSFNKVDGLGVFRRNGMYELGVFTSKRKNGVFIEFNSNYLWIRRYRDEVQYGEEIKVDLHSFTLTYRSASGSSKNTYLSELL